MIYAHVSVVLLSFFYPIKDSSVVSRHSTSTPRSGFYLEISSHDLPTKKAEIAKFRLKEMTLGNMSCGKKLRIVFDRSVSLRDQ